MNFSDDKVAAVAGFLRYLTSPRHLTICRLLAQKGELDACAFRNTLQVSQPLVSHYLRILREGANLIGFRTVGKRHLYRLQSSADLQLAIDLLGQLQEKRAKKKRNPAKDQEPVELSRVVASLSDPLRLRLCFRLTEREESVGRLTQLLGTSKQATGYHLDCLKDGQMVTFRINGWTNFYSFVGWSGVRRLLDELQVIKRGIGKASALPIKLAPTPAVAAKIKPKTKSSADGIESALARLPKGYVDERETLWICYKGFCRDMATALQQSWKLLKSPDFLAWFQGRSPEEQRRWKNFFFLGYQISKPNLKPGEQPPVMAEI